MFKKIKAIYDGNDFIPTEPIPIKESYEVNITFFEPFKVLLLPHDEDWANQFEIIKKNLIKFLETMFMKYITLAVRQ